MVDLIVIGGGIVGLATAYQYSRSYPDRKVVVLEKEANVAEHQTGRNSGVLHSGIYYKPGSLKAINCRAGKLAMQEFCASEGIPFEICGKVIVAVTEADLPALQMIYERGQANGVNCAMISPERLQEIEPAAQGVRAVHVPETGIVDYRAVCKRLAEKLRIGGNEVVFQTKVVGLKKLADSILVQTSKEEYKCRKLVNCAGLYSDHVTKLSGERTKAKIIPFRGEYYALKQSAWGLCKNLIYPTPNPAFPFLGVHFTRMIDGSIECGPNAVFAFGRESYRFFDVNIRETRESLGYRGFQRMMWKHWRMGLNEMWRSLNKKAFVRALQQLVPSIRSEDIIEAPAGIRAQAVANDGSLVDDFLIQESDRIVNVCNAPSPAATAAFTIGETIVKRLQNGLV